LVLECVDPQFLRSFRKLSAFTHFTFLVLVVLNLVGGFHALGTLMAVGIMLLPATAGRFWTNGISSLIIVAIIFAMLSSFTGLLLSYHYNLAVWTGNHSCQQYGLRDVVLVWTSRRNCEPGVLQSSD
jgi:zinc/manganese transport system permease protein